jgi:GTP-binding protein Era
MALRSGFVCILGRPNAGKSTLLNALVQQKLAIVSPKPQTTRNRILGVVHVPKEKGRPEAQIVLLDTPGVHRPDSSLGRKMMAEVHESLEGCDLVLLLVDATKSGADNLRHFDLRKQENFVFELAKRSGTPAFLLLNKIDLLRGEKQKLLPLIASYKEAIPFKEVIPLSAKTGNGIHLLLDEIVKYMPIGPRHFPEDQVTDQPLRFMCAETIREQVLLHTSEEVPHATSVVMDQFEEGPKLTRITATIHCEREGQKRILIGRHGQMLKKVGTAARLQIEKMLEGKKVFLELFVKVSPDWRNSRLFVEELDWRQSLGF